MCLQAMPLAAIKHPNTVTYPRAFFIISRRLLKNLRSASMPADAGEYITAKAQAQSDL